MDETFYIEGIILRRTRFREQDSKVVILTKDNGKVELVARGAMKIRSKLSGHIEPITHINGMIVKGRQYDYLGSVIGESFYHNIRSDLGKLSIAGRLASSTDRSIKAGEKSGSFFNLLKNFLDTLEEKKISDGNLYCLIYGLKLMDLLGSGPELFKCLHCGVKLKTGGNYFVCESGGTLCPKCSKGRHDTIRISDNALKFLRLILDKRVEKISKISITKKNLAEIKDIIEKFVDYHK